MTYVSAAMLAVPTAGKAAYAEFSTVMAPMIRGLGALRAVDAWGDDVPAGQRTDMFRAVEATPDETPVFSWIEFPDAETAEACFAAMMAEPEGGQVPQEMPFDGARMIFAGFEPLCDRGAARPGDAEVYVDAALFPVAADAREAYAARAVRMAEAFLEVGALRCFDGWGVYVPEGKRTDMRRAVALGPDEALAMGFIEWPSKAVRDAGWVKLMEGPSLSGLDDGLADMARMIQGGFSMLVDA
ncbi:DUF1428 family protein [uncultured Albimonas sp.]|uniref:DUF1428 domain-containing protein n=1 Tax=uncultured Albimonas sp. TaxID=1331701 RepID=UPI0030EF7C50